MKEFLSEADFQLFAAIGSNLWFNRTLVAHDKPCFMPGKFVEMSISMINQFVDANQSALVCNTNSLPNCWKPPNGLFIKVNFDAAIYDILTVWMWASLFEIPLVIFWQGFLCGHRVHLILKWQKLLPGGWQLKWQLKWVLDFFISKVTAFLLFKRFIKTSVFSFVGTLVADMKWFLMGHRE